MNVGDRVVVKGGPWPERVGAHGVIVGGAVTLYPFGGLGERECVILLDADPLRRDATADEPFRASTAENERWSCVIARTDLVKELW